MTDEIDAVGNVFSEILSNLVDQGFELPLVVAAIAVNGSVSVARFARSPEGVAVQVLANHIEGGGFQTPVNIMVTDSNGDAARVVVGADARITVLN